MDSHGKINYTPIANQYVLSGSPPLLCSSTLELLKAKIFIASLLLEAFDTMPKTALKAIGKVTVPPYKFPPCLITNRLINRVEIRIRPDLM